MPSQETSIGIWHRHLGVLFFPVLAAAVLGGLVTAALKFSPPAWQPWSHWALAALTTVLAIIWVVRPIVRWFAETVELTNLRLIINSGGLAKTSRDILLGRIVAVGTRQLKRQRLLGRGTLVIDLVTGERIELTQLARLKKISKALVEQVIEAVEKNQQGRPQPGPTGQVRSPGRVKPLGQVISQTPISHPAGQHPGFGPGGQQPVSGRTGDTQVLPAVDMDGHPLHSFGADSGGRGARSDLEETIVIQPVDDSYFRPE